MNANNNTIIIEVSGGMVSEVRSHNRALQVIVIDHDDRKDGGEMLPLTAEQVAAVETVPGMPWTSVLDPLMGVGDGLAGRRNLYLFNLGRNFGPAVSLKDLSILNTKHCAPPLPESEVEAIYRQLTGTMEVPIFKPLVLEYNWDCHVILTAEAFLEFFTLYIDTSPMLPIIPTVFGEYPAERAQRILDYDEFWDETDWSFHSEEELVGMIDGFRKDPREKDLAKKYGRMLRELRSEIKQVTK